MPDSFPAFCQSNLLAIYGLYGLAFFVTGIAVALESGRASKLVLPRTLPFLAAFGLMHGVHEWIDMYGLMQPATPPSTVPTVVEAVNVMLLAVSFICLIEFAVRLMRLLDAEKYRGWGWLTWLLSAIYIVAVIGYRAAPFKGDEVLFWRVADILARYILGITGSALACWAMLVQRRAFVREGYAQFSRDLIGGALAFAWYAIFQFVVPPSPYFPSSVINTASFLAYTGIPVQLFRAVVGVGAAVFIIRVMHVFEIEYARRLEALNRARFETQENAARELTVLYETCRILGTTLDLNFLLNEALNRIVTLVEPVRAGTIFLIDPGEHALVARASYRNSTANIPPDFAERARDLAQRSVESKEIAYGPAQNVDSVLAIPLVSDDKAIGALCLMHAGAFSNFAVLQTLARQLVIAIENARLYEQVQEKEELRGRLLERVVAAQEEERKRLARDLHDQTGQRLTALALGLSSVNELLDRNPALARERLKELEGMSAGAIDDLRQFVADLRPSLLDDLGLVAALRQTAKQTEERSNVTIEFNLSGQRRRLRSQFETVLYRIAQEALNNTVRHAQATRATIDLNFGEKAVALTIEDNGRGFEPVSVLKPQAQVRAWGLLGMQERVALVGGTFEIESAPGRGTRLVAEIPLESVEGGHAERSEVAHA
jgi:signal transduction histidine kinase